MDRLLVIQKRIFEAGRMVFFFWSVFVFLCVQYLNVSTFSTLFTQWQRAQSNFDYTRLATATGVALFATGIFLWAALELLPSTWKTWLESKFPSKQR